MGSECASLLSSGCWSRRRACMELASAPPINSKSKRLASISSTAASTFRDQAGHASRPMRLNLPTGACSASTTLRSPMRSTEGRGPPEAAQCTGVEDVGSVHHDTVEDVWYECVLDRRRNLFTWSIL